MRFPLSLATRCALAAGLLASVTGCGADGGSDNDSGGGQTQVVPPPGPLAAPVGAGGNATGSAGVGGNAGASIGPVAGAAPSVAGSGGAGGAALAGAGGVGGAGMAGAAGTSAAGTGGAAGSMAPIGDLCARWKAARTNLSEGAWSGSTSGCDPGDMTAEARGIALGLHSLYRSMAGLEPVEMTDEGNRLAQGCALLMDANGQLSHMPDSSWTCYTSEFGEAAGTSSIGGGNAISAVDGYMVDPGNPTTLGHRRWVLSNMLESVGFGSTGSFTCQYQPAMRPPTGAKAWVAWPPPGQIPIQAFSSAFAKLDQTGWSVQSDTVDLASAQVSVTSDGAELPVTVTQLLPGYGSSKAMRFNAMGWTAAAGKTYHVELSGTSMPIEYDVEVIDCK